MAWLATFFTGLAAWLTSILGRKVATALAVLAVWAAVTLTFATALTSILNSISVAMPGGMVAAGLSMLPSNSTACLGAIISGHAAAWIYTQKVKLLSIKLKS